MVCRHHYNHNLHLAKELCEESKTWTAEGRRLNGLRTSCFTFFRLICLWLKFEEYETVYNCDRRRLKEEKWWWRKLQKKERKEVKKLALPRGWSEMKRSERKLFRREWKTRGGFAFRIHFHLWLSLPLPSIRNTQIVIILECNDDGFWSSLPFSLIIASAV